MTSVSGRRWVEMTEHPLFSHRVRRLVLISAVALGLITVLAIRAEAPAWSIGMIAAGWVLMPMILALSLKRPKARYALVVPASLVTIGLVGPLVTSTGWATVGWTMILVGILVGGSLGMWFWYRWLPVPHGYDDPYSTRRIALIGAHIGLILIGAAIVFSAG